MLVVNLGCGKLPVPNMVNVDEAYDEAKGILGIDLDDYAWNIVTAFKNNGIYEGSVDAFIGIHFLEHITNPLHLMNALYTLIKPGGYVEFHVPYGSSDDADTDPTHVRRYFLDSWMYFTASTYKRSDYGLRANWQVTATHLNLQEGVPLEPDELEYRLRHARNIVHTMKVVLQACEQGVELPRPEVKFFPHGQHYAGLILRDIMPASPPRSSPSPQGDPHQGPSSWSEGA